MAIRVTQSGVALTVGIIVVTGIIIGGFFYVKNAGEQARHEEAVKIAEQNLEEQSKNGVALNEGESNSDSNDSATSGNDATNNEDKTSEGTSSSDSTNNSSSGQPNGELPQTGPADQLPSLIILALLTFSIATYIASRRQVSSQPGL